MESESIVERATKAARDAWDEATGRTPALSQDEAWAVSIRAAISAMREPTGPMAHAAAKHAEAWRARSHLDWFSDMMSDAIDAALK